VIRFEEFSDIFHEMNFRPEELKKFYSSVKKSVVLRHLGKRAWPAIFALEEGCQWPVLEKIDNPNLSIYRDADTPTLERFLKTISSEKNLKMRKSDLDNARFWTLLQCIIDERTDLFMKIFDFTGKDVMHCKIVAERYGKILERKIRNRKKLWKIGIGAGAATLAGAAALWYYSRKDDK
jgi:hypothetical protein